MLHENLFLRPPTCGEHSVGDARAGASGQAGDLGAFRSFDRELGNDHFEIDSAASYEKGGPSILFAAAAVKDDA